MDLWPFFSSQHVCRNLQKNPREMFEQTLLIVFKLKDAIEMLSVSHDFKAENKKAFK